jgi:hypothetical protein
VISAPKNSANSANPINSNAIMVFPPRPSALPSLVAGLSIAVQNLVKLAGLTPYRAADTVRIDSRA